MNQREQSDRVQRTRQLLTRLTSGDPTAAGELIPLVYQELLELAHSLLAKERAGLTLETGDLVHTAWDRIEGPEAHWDGRGHFFAAAAEAMRRILVDHARRKQRPKHGGDRQRVLIGDGPAVFGMDPDLILALNEALDRLEAIDVRKVQVVKQRFFNGLSVKETAELLNVSERTVEQDWKFARAWLQLEMSKGDTRG